MKKGTEFKIFIASPSDLQKERKEIRNYINDIRGENTYFTATMWEENLPATTVDYKEKGAQGIINEELLDKSDIVIGIFRLKFGAKTDEHESATVGEIEESIAKGKPVILYFWNSQKTASELTEDEIEGLAKIKEFKKKYADKGIYKEVNSIEEIKSNIVEDLKYNGYFLFEATAPEGFTKDDRYFYFQIETNGESIVIENESGIGFTNEPIPVPNTSPKTGDPIETFLWIELAVGALAILVVSTYVKIRNRKYRR